MKAVLDSNIFLSGLMFPKSVPGKILTAWHHAQFDLVLSEPMLDEITRVLAYPKIRKHLAWSDETIEQFVTLLRFQAEIVDIRGIIAIVPHDADDNPILATLIASCADCLVSGDSDLLELRNEYAIETAAEFVVHRL